MHFVQSWFCPHCTEDFITGVQMGAIVFDDVIVETLENGLINRSAIVNPSDEVLVKLLVVDG